MNALDFTARALALRAVAQTPLNFQELTQARLPASVTRIESNGFAQAGLGAGVYVADELADEALRAAHPEAVFEGGSGRFFRLAGDHHGYITPEQLGCPEYAPGTNQQAYIQAAIAYVEAVGLKGVLLTRPKYELWATARNGGAVNIFVHTDYSGHFLVVRGRVAIHSSVPGRTTLHFKGPTGGSLETDYQTLTGTHPSYPGVTLIWRGSGILVTSQVAANAAAADPATLNMLDLRDVNLLSDAVGSHDVAWPATTLNPNSWDVTNEGVRFQPDVQHTVSHLENVEIRGFLGECIYGMGAYGNNSVRCGIVGRNLRMFGSNASALNLNGAHVSDFDGVYAENCSFTMEGWAGWEVGRIVNATFKDCISGGLSGGNIYYADLRPDNSQPFCSVDMKMENCGVFYAGSMLKGRLHLIDTRLALVENGNIIPLTDVDLDVTCEVNKGGAAEAITLSSHASAPPKSIENVQVRALVTRSQYAMANNIIFNSAVGLSGSFGPNCTIRLRGDHGGKLGALTAIYGSLTDYRAKVIDEGLYGTGNQSLGFTGAPAFNAVTTPTPEFGYCFLNATFGGSAISGVYPVTPPATTMFNDGHEVIIEHNTSSCPNAFLLVGGKVLVGYRQRVKLRAKKLHNRWDIIEAPPPIRATASIDIASTGLGTESGPYTIAVPGCRPNMIAQVVPPAAGAPGFVVSAVRPDADLVKFWVRNVESADPADFAAATWTALVRGPEA
jgi:hypothetical protein